MIHVRRAQIGDIALIVEALLCADASGTGRSTYAYLFGLDDDSLRELFTEMVKEDVDSCEYCISGFLVAEQEGAKVGACCSWIEGESQISSPIARGSLLHHFLPETVRTHFADKAAALQEFHGERTLGAIQIEAVYVREGGRGRRIAQKLITQHVQESSLGPTSLVQLFVAASNEPALKAYRRMGFLEESRLHLDDAKLASYLPSATKLQLQCTVAQITQTEAGAL